MSLLPNQPLEESPEWASPGRFRKEKMGFWCPGDIDAEINRLIDAGIYQDRSKACVALIRQGLHGGLRMREDVEERLKQIAQFLDREPDTVIIQCIQSLFELLDAPSTVPLLVEEIRLREKRQTQQCEPK